MTNSTNPAGNDDNFAFVGGRPAQVSASMETDESPTGLVMQAIAVLLDWRRSRSFHCVADFRFGSDDSTFKISAQPMYSSYVCTNMQTGYEESFDGMKGVRLSGGEVQEMSAAQLSTEPMALNLVFPLNLPVWGRPSDTSRMVSGRREGKLIIVDLVGAKDGLPAGELAVDTTQRIAVRLDIPVSQHHTGGIEPHFG
jgi:hypothetical protein